MKVKVNLEDKEGIDISKDIDRVASMLKKQIGHWSKKQILAFAVDQHIRMKQYQDLCKHLHEQNKELEGKKDESTEA